MLNIGAIACVQPQASSVTALGNNDAQVQKGHRMVGHSSATAKSYNVSILQIMYLLTGFGLYVCTRCFRRVIYEQMCVAPEHLISTDIYERFYPGRPYIDITEQAWSVKSGHE